MRSEKGRRGMRDLEQLTEWRDSLRRISDDVRDALIRRLIFREVQEIVRRNEKLEGRFNAWMKANYVAAAPLAVRRHVVRDKKSICFDQLLEEFGGHPLLFPRDNFRSYYTRPDLARLADWMFDKFGGPGGDHLSRAVIKGDPAKLRKANRKS